MLKSMRLNFTISFWWSPYLSSGSYMRGWLDVQHPLHEFQAFIYKDDWQAYENDGLPFCPVQRLYAKQALEEWYV